jgi:hypothetical protein
MLSHYRTFAENVPLSKSYDRGKYGRLFSELLPQADEMDRELHKDLSAIAENMIVGQKGTNIPAGYTYLGQFIAHDITFDATSTAERQIDPENLWNFRTPALDLDSVYGAGPTVNPALYAYEGHSNVRTKFALEKITDSRNPDISFFDLPRYNHQALIADPRNDENLVISQLHTVFLLLHNNFYEKEETKYQNKHNKKELSNAEKVEIFEKAQRLTRWHYQYVVINDYLIRIVGKSIVDELLRPINDEFKAKVKELFGGGIMAERLMGILGSSKLHGRMFYNWRNEPFIPLEFSAAAFRLGHSQVRGFYFLNKHTPHSQNIIKKDKPKTFIDWSLFFKERAKNLNFNISPYLVRPLSVIPYTGGNLAYLNLLRGVKLKLPSGQAVARAMGERPMEIAAPGFPARWRNNTPLWYYILNEALKEEDGKRLGRVGGRIVAEVIIGLIQGDKCSYLNIDPSWYPPTGKNFDMEKLLELAGVSNGALCDPNK